MTFVLFRYLLGVILEASNVLSEAVTAIQKQYDGNDFTFQQCKEFIPKTEEAIRTVRVFGCCSEISLRYLKKKKPLKTLHFSKGGMSFKIRERKIT